MIGQREVRFSVSNLTERDSLRKGTTNKKAAKVTTGRSTEWGRRRGGLQTDRKVKAETDGQTERPRQNQTCRQKGQGRNRQMDRKAKAETDRWTERPRQKQTGGQQGQGRNRQTARPRQKQTG